MSNNKQKQLTPVVIFDRSNPDASDVPVFSSALKKKVNTPVDTLVSDGLSIKTQAILARIVSPSRADSSGGQTGGFAHGEELTQTQPLPIEAKNPAVAVATPEPTKAFFYEEPTLIRIPFATNENPEEREAVVDHTLVQTPLETVLSIPVLSQDEDAKKTQESTTFENPRWVYIQNVLTRCLFTLATELPKFVSVLVLGCELLAHYGRTSVSALQMRIQTRKKEKQPDLSEVLTAIETPMQKKAGRKFPPLMFFSRWKAFCLFWCNKIGSAVLQSGTALWKYLSGLNFYAIASRTMIAASLVLMLLTVGPMVALQVQSWREQIGYSIKNLSSKADDSTPTPKPEATATPTPTPNPDPEKQFQIIIPKLGVNSKIVANVDAANEKEYSAALKRGVAHAAGTGLPGEENTENKTVFIFGHSTNGEWNIARYNALFYSLKDMNKGDTFSIWFWGNEFHYTVKETKIVEANDVSFLKPQTSKEQVILQTCWPPGTSWKRFLVIAEPSTP